MLIVAHGQPSAPEPPERALAELAAKINDHWPEGQVRAATMAAPGALEAALEALAPGAPIYPFFMASGWFVNTALAKRLEGRDVPVLPPFGLDAELPSLAAKVLASAAQDQGWALADCHILLAAHGSARGPRAAQSAEDFAARLTPLLSGATVRCGFVEQAPFLPDLVPDLPEKTLCLPFFAMEGDHVRDDVTKGLRGAGFAGPILPALGQGQAVPALIARAVAQGMTAVTPV